MPATLVDIAAFYIVRRPFTALGVELERGEVVDVEGWINVQPLINTHRIQPAPHDIIDKVVECGCGRAWETKVASDTHDCPKRKPAEPESAPATPVNPKKKETA